MFGADTIPDPSDWLETPLKGLTDLETALHCQICKEFYDTPMITSCNHTFCSRCIRTSFSADGRCPACRTLDQANKLRNNWAIQEVVAAFTAARPAVLKVAQEAQQEIDTPQNARKRRRVETSDSATNISEHDASTTRTTRSRSRKLASSQTSQPEAIEIDDLEEDAEDEYVPPPDDGLFACPLGCGKRMKEEAVYLHLDSCDTVTAPKKANATANGTASSKPKPSQSTRPQDRIPELNYSMMKETAISRKLGEIGIPTWGSKQVMTNRHREWVNIWNANCDSNRPRTHRELLQELDHWERTQGAKAPRGNSQVMRKDFDKAGYANRNKDDFSRLIADARRKKNSAPASSENKETDASSAPNDPPDSKSSSSTQPATSSPPQSAAIHTQAQPKMLSPPTQSTTVSIFHSSHDAIPASPSTSSTANPHRRNSQQWAPPAQPLPQLASSSSMSPLPPDQHPRPQSSASSATGDEHRVRQHTGVGCELPAHMSPADPGLQKVPLFAVPRQASVSDVDGE